MFPRIGSLASLMRRLFHRPLAAPGESDFAAGSLFFFRPAAASEAGRAAAASRCFFGRYAGMGSRRSARSPWPAFMVSCGVLARKPEWQQPCAAARSIDAARPPGSWCGVFETYFVPYRTFNPDGSGTRLVTEYYEPLLKRFAQEGRAVSNAALFTPGRSAGARSFTDLYPELKNMRLRGRVVGKKVVPYFTRGELAIQSICC